MALLGYSVFAYVEGLEARAIELSIKTPADQPTWPVFSTRAPKAPAAAEPLTARAADFYELADSQILMGPGFRVSRIRSSPDLFLAIHAEGEGIVVTTGGRFVGGALVPVMVAAARPEGAVVVPEISPVAGSRLNPAGRPSAAYVVAAGLLVIW